MWTVLIYGQLMCVNSINFIDALPIPVESEDVRFHLSVQSSLTPFKGQSVRFSEDGSREEKVLNRVAFGIIRDSAY